MSRICHVSVAIFGTNKDNVRSSEAHPRDRLLACNYYRWLLLRDNQTNKCISIFFSNLIGFTDT